MQEDYKALTVVHLPFATKDGKTFQPGAKIPREAFEKNAAGAEEANPDGETLTAEEQVASLIEWGSLSEDLEADLHPDHLPVDPGQPTIARMIEEARQLRDILQARGESVPAELDALANIDHNHVGSKDSGKGGDAS